MLSFLHPDWFWLLAALPVLALAKWRADVRGERAVGLVVAARLRHALVRGRSPGRSWAIFGLQLAGLAFLAVTLARPRLGEEKRELKETGRNILIALDTSRSMLATDTMNPADVKPDRLTRAKLAAQDLLALLPGDRVGLVAFAGQAYLQAPLTTDHDAVIETIQSVDHTSVPRGGTDLRKALQVAMETFEKSPARNHGLIIFSDGGDPDPELVAMARRAAEKRILILAVGVGSDAGSDIPDPDAGQTSAYLRGNGNPALAQDNRPRVRDENGNVVISKLESAVLQQLAAATGGSFFKLGSRPLTRGLVASLLATLDQQQASAREETKPIERFQWPLTLAIILLMIAWLIRPKRGGAPLAPAAAAALLVLATPVPGSAEILATSSTEGRASDAPRAYEQGLFEVARDIYARLKGEKSEPEKRHELAYGLGASSLKLKDYDRAVSAFSEALESENAEVQHRSHRGLGHALYDQGDKTLAKQPQFTLKAWTDAIRYFEAALKIEGEDKEVRENLDFVKSRIKELKAQIEQQQQKQQKQQGGKKGDKKEDGTSENGGKDGREPSDKGKQGKEGQEGQEGQQGQQGDQRGKQGRQGEEGQEGEEGKERDGGKGEGKDDEQEGKGARKDEVPEGRIQAGDEGGGGDPVQMMRDRENAERNTETGFSRNEARDYLRMFSDDQKQVQFRQSRREPARGKDW